MNPIISRYQNGIKLLEKLHVKLFWPHPTQHIQWHHFFLLLPQSSYYFISTFLALINHFNCFIFRCPALFHFILQCPALYYHTHFSSDGVRIIWTAHYSEIAEFILHLNTLWTSRKWNKNQYWFKNPQKKASGQQKLHQQLKILTQ